MALNYGNARCLLPAIAGSFVLLLTSCGGKTFPIGPTLVAPETPMVKVRNHQGDGYSTSIPSLGAALALNEDRPDSYTVVRGDTLWDISGKFLEEPWRWREVWGANPNIDNPHLIYPGDKLRITYDEAGRPKLVLNRNGVDLNAFDVAENSNSGNVTRLSPRIRVESLEEAISTISSDQVRQFLAFPKVVSPRDLAKAPYVLGNEEGRLASAVGQEIYARGDIANGQRGFGIFRRNKILRDPVTRETLGQEITHVANARLIEPGDPSTLVITKNFMETISGDRLLTSTARFTPHQYIPRTPQFEGAGRVVSLVDAISRSGRNQVVVLNLGERNEIKVGDVLAIERQVGRVYDRFAGRGKKSVQPPSKRSGVVLVFQTFDKVSYGLIMESSRPIHRNDLVTAL